MKAVRRTLFHDLVGLVLPRCCAGCDRPLMRAENCICLHCLQDLPRTLTEKVLKPALRESAERRLGELWDRERAGIVLRR